MASPADKFAKKMAEADSERDFSWRRVQEVERERPSFALNEVKQGYSEPRHATVTDDGQLNLYDYWLPKERALALAHWIIETFGDS